MLHDLNSCSIMQRMLSKLAQHGRKRNTWTTVFLQMCDSSYDDDRAVSIHSSFINSGANPRWHWVKGRVQHGQGWHLELKHHTHSHSHISGQFKVTRSPNLIVFGLWEEAGVPRWNPSRYWENMQTPFRKECTTVLPSCAIYRNGTFCKSR